MAKNSEKKISASNRRILFKQTQWIVILSIVYALYRIWWKKSTFTNWHLFGFVSLTLIKIASVILMKKMATVKGADELLKYSGLDLASEDNIASYFMDIIYICRFVLVMTMFSDKYWWVLLVIPAYALYKAWDKILKPFFFSPSADPQTLSKTQQKKQAKKDKIKYVK